jgi:protein SCO1/2
MRRTILLMTAWLALGGHAWAESPADLLASKERFFSPKVGAEVPRDIWFVDETGKRVTLGDYGGDRPVILVQAYYRCPQLCTLVLNDLVKGLRGVGLFQPGRNLDVVVVSFDPEEKPELAAAKKAAYVEDYGRPGSEGGWHFLTGEKEQIDRLADATGFHAVWDEEKKQYAHVRAITILSPGWKVTHYFTGGSFAPLYLSQALTQATTGKTGSFLNNFLQMCFIYDPVTSRYSLNILFAIRVGGGVVIALLLLMWLYMGWRAWRGSPPVVGQDGNGPGYEGRLQACPTTGEPPVATTAKGATP